MPNIGSSENRNKSKIMQHFFKSIYFLKIELKSMKRVSNVVVKKFNILIFQHKL